MTSVPQDGPVNFVQCEEDNISKQIWTITPGAGDTVAFDGVSLVIHVVIPPEYPFKSPDLKLEKHIYHPNVLDGKLCLGTLKNWKPQYKIITALEELTKIIMHPDTDSALSPEAADIFNAHRDQYVIKALDSLK